MYIWFWYLLDINIWSMLLKCNNKNHSGNNDNHVDSNEVDDSARYLLLWTPILRMSLSDLEGPWGSMSVDLCDDTLNTRTLPVCELHYSTWSELFPLRRYFRSKGKILKPEVTRSVRYHNTAHASLGAALIHFCAILAGLDGTRVLLG